jgi:predicted HTH transcriptional regulator
MNEQDFAALLALGHETRGVEFKGPGSRTDKAFLAWVVRGVLGMANRSDGGRVIIGVEDHAGVLTPKGLDVAQLESWRSYDDVVASINEYASPRVSLERQRFVFQGHNIVILQAAEFEDIPILCRKEYQSPRGRDRTTILRQGACYVRSRHKPETSEIPSEEEMRELLDLAIDKGVRGYPGITLLSRKDLRRKASPVSRVSTRETSPQDHCHRRKSLAHKEQYYRIDSEKVY